MQAIIHTISQAAMFVVIIGGALSAVFIALAGFQYVTSGGDPQKIAQARSSLFGVMFGMLIIGMSFVLPRILSQAVIEPAGGAPLRSDFSHNDCDRLLQSQLVFQRSAWSPSQMNSLIAVVKARWPDLCGPSSSWDPQLFGASLNHYSAAGSGYASCFDNQSQSISSKGVRLPTSFLTDSNPKELILDRSGRRDSGNNIMVLFQDGTELNNGDPCWFYISSLDAWYTVSP